MDEKNWFAILTRSRAEKQVATRLNLIGIENYLPLKRSLKKWKNRTAWVEEPLLKGYVFVHLTEKGRSAVFGVSGIVCYLFVSGKIAKITDKEIEHLKFFCSLAEIKIEKNNLEKGAEIEIISGQLISLRGQLVSNEKRKKIKIYIELLKCYVVISTENVEIREIENKAVK
jgi:transcriptional antiterminator RfaH